jgi:arylsulfatase
MFGCRAIYHDGWKAVVYHPIFDPNVKFDDDRWELYHVDEDASECHDVAAQHPELLRELVERWWIEAAKYRVLPLDNSPFDRLFGEDAAGDISRSRFVYYPMAGPVTEEAAVNLRNRSHTITAEVELPDRDVEGILLAMGSILGGFVFYVQGHRLHYVHNFGGLEVSQVTSDVELSPGKHVLAFRFEKTREHRGTGTLLVDGAAAGSVEIKRFTPTRFSITDEGLCCGYDIGMPVVDEYRPPFRFTGRLRRVVVDVEGGPYVDPVAEAELSMQEQ